jgi:hypothetical protein
MAKEPSEKQLAARAKFAAASKAKAAARKAEQTKTPEQPQVTAPEAKDPGNPGEPTTDQLQRAVLETLQNLFGGVNPAQLQGAQLTDRGVVGTKERYPTDPSLYPDPRERIADEEALASVAFRHNYELYYTCQPTKRYQTQDGIWFVEPQFTLELHRIVLENGKPTNTRYTICRGIFFEDPETAIQMAFDLGVEVPEGNQFEFLNEMRYIRMRDWVLDAFFTPIDTSPQQNKREMSIDGQLVEVWEVSGEDAQSIPFQELRSKVKG